MDNHLVEYLLNALDGEGCRQVENRLAQDPVLGRRLELLRQALAPLEADRADAPPPPSLIPGTIGLVAEQMCRPLPQAPLPKRERFGVDRAWWRRADVLIAACLLIAALGIAVPFIAHSHRNRYQTAQCQENLRAVFSALESYHQAWRRYPQGKKPRDAAGMALPILRDRGDLAADKTIACPAKASKPSLDSLDELEAMDIPEFVRCAPDLNPTYAYHLGSLEGGVYQAPKKVDGFHSLMPLMADAAACDGSGGNSSNHAGAGQNVLFQDGHVKFATSRYVGVDGDDIYLNKDKKVAAGLDRLDAVLGCSAAKP